MVNTPKDSESESRCYSVLFSYAKFVFPHIHTLFVNPSLMQSHADTSRTAGIWEDRCGILTQTAAPLSIPNAADRPQTCTGVPASGGSEISWIHHPHGDFSDAW